MSADPKKFLGFTVDKSISLPDIFVFLMAAFAVYSVWFETKSDVRNNAAAIVREEGARIENDQWLASKIKKVETDLKGDIANLSTQMRENHAEIINRLQIDDSEKEQRRRDAHDERQKIMSLIIGLERKAAN